MLKFLLIYTLFITQAIALEVDERLTLRIVNTSESKKTVLINRGIEDGLAKGDHAKFFVSTGVIARGVCIKLSPTRSVWSLYRLVNPTYVKDEQVLKLKITPAVKITKDESRMLVQDAVPASPRDPRDLGIPLAEGADDIKDEPKTSENADLFMNRGAGSLVGRNKEVFGMIHYSSNTEKTTPSSGTEEYSQNVSNFMLVLGGEWYLTDQQGWLKYFSLMGNFILDRKAVMGHLGSFVKENSSYFGGGVNLYPFALPTEVNKFISYLGGSMNIGSSNSTYTSGSEGNDDETLSASVLMYQFTYGLKYYASNGLGVRLEFSYMQRADSYEEDENNVSYTLSKGGTKILGGMSYRF